MVGEWLARKQESALLRVDRTNSLPTPDNWLPGSSMPNHAESSIAALVDTAGLVRLCLVVVWLVISLRSTTAKTREWLVPILAGFLFAWQLVPYFGVFPLGTLFPLLVSQAARPPEYGRMMKYENERELRPTAVH